MPFECSFVVLVLALALPTTGCSSKRTEKAASSDTPPQSVAARILSAAVGSDTGTSCPNGMTGLDNMPVTFDRFILGSSIDVTDFAVVLEDGTSVTPICALQYPPNEPNELQTVNLIGDFGKTSGPRPSQLRLAGALEGHLPLDDVGQPLGEVAPHEITQLEAAPFIVDAWTLTPQLLVGDTNGCTVGSTFVRVVWSNGMTRYPGGDELDAEVVASYQVDYELPSGELRSLTPLAIGDLSDHPPKVFLDDNMHDLCLPDVPSGAVLKAIEIGANRLQDPNGDPNDAQTFQLR
ncbi:MAG TPA: hypothetical protein VGC79_24480 [Polyangiaceae bacterium]